MRSTAGKPDLRKRYELYVLNRLLYRAYSSEHNPYVKKRGLDPARNPFQKDIPDLKRFFKILDHLEKKGYAYVYPHWPRTKPIGSFLSRVHRKALGKKCLYLTPNFQNDLDYFFSRKGGDIPHTINHISEDLIRYGYPLTKTQSALVLKLQRWAKARMRYRMQKISIKATSRYLEKAGFWIFDKTKHLPSPFGSFEHFEKVIRVHGWNAYRPYLTGKKNFELRITRRIPKEEIKFL